MASLELRWCEIGGRGRQHKWRRAMFDSRLLRQHRARSVGLRETLISLKDINQVVDTGCTKNSLQCQGSPLATAASSCHRLPICRHSLSQCCRFGCCCSSRSGHTGCCRDGWRTNARAASTVHWANPDCLNWALWTRNCCAIYRMTNAFWLC